MCVLERERERERGERHTHTRKNRETDRQCTFILSTQTENCDVLEIFVVEATGLVSPVPRRVIQPYCKGKICSHILLVHIFYYDCYFHHFPLSKVILGRQILRTKVVSDADGITAEERGVRKVSDPKVSGKCKRKACTKRK